MSPHAITLSTPRIASGMRLDSASARARAPSRSLSARIQACVERQHFRACVTQTPTSQYKTNHSSGAEGESEVTDSVSDWGSRC